MRSEATWTRPRPDCQEPWLWSAPDSQSTEVEVSQLVGAFVRALKPEYCVETGTHKGHTAIHIAKALQDNDRGHLTSLEWHLPLVLEARENLSGYPEVTVVHTDSRTWKPTHPIDFAWLDSEFESRCWELAHWRPRFFGIHDTGPHYPVAQAIKAVPQVELLWLPTPRGVVFGRCLP